MFEKNPSSTVKDLLIKGIVSKTPYPQDVIEKVIAFQGEDILRATKEVSEIEISGLGIIYVSQKKLNNRIDRWEKFVEKSKEKGVPSDNIEKLIEYLKTKHV